MQQHHQPPTPPHHTLAPMPPQLPPTNITTEQIQKYLDENKQLILAILDNQNLGKLSECAQYQAQLQKNLLYLAAIADAQPQPPAVRAQMLPHAAMQQGGHHYTQQQQQPPIFAPKSALQFNPQLIQEQQQQQQQQQLQHQLHHQTHLLPIQGHMGAMRPGLNNGMHVMHNAEASLVGSIGLPPPSLSEFPHGGGTPSSSSLDGRGSKQDATAGSESASANGHRSSNNEHGSGDGEPPLLKRPQEAKTP